MTDKRCHGFHSRNPKFFNENFTTFTTDMSASYNTNGTSINQLQIGFVKFFNQTKRYGFIRPKEKRKPDVFFHESNIVQTSTKPLQPGDRVSFYVGMNMRRNKSYAFYVRKAKKKKKKKKKKSKKKK